MEGGWLCIFGAFLEGCIVWRLVGLGGLFHLLGCDSLTFVDTVLCSLLLLQSLDLLYRVVRSYFQSCVLDFAERSEFSF